MVRVIRVTARVIGVLVLLIFLASFIGQGPPRLSAMTTREALGSLAICLSLAGLVATWRWEAVGGALAIGGFALNFLASRSVVPRALWLAPLAGILFLLLRWKQRAGSGRMAPAPRRRRPLTVQFAGRIALAVAAAVVAWLAVETALPAPLITSRAATVPAVTGRWEGSAKVVDEWGPPGELAVVFSVNGDGTAEGTIGAASFRNAPLVPNRSWLGSLFHVRSDYRLHGGLSGLITPRYVIECASFTLPLNFGPQSLDGRLTALDCARAGKKHGSMHATLVRFRKPVPRTR
jgi:hypothetical protein